MRTALLTAIAMAAFASNSLLCRAALGSGAGDAASFTAVRLAAGAAALVLLARGRLAGGSWLSALALGAYAVAFSLAYLRLTAGTGALILFAAVQVTMVGAAVARRERIGARAWAGMILALAGLVALTSPGLTAPDAIGALLMSVAGVSWGVYSLRGRAATEPIRANADNFTRSLAIAALALALTPLAGGTLSLTAKGVWLACVSGALASGVGYAIWYAALRGLRRTEAAVVQLSVPALAAVGGALLLGERPTLRLVACGLAILAGIALAVTPAARSRADA
jgi:drug/metabolite transporter (DMT)-like permease